MQDVTLTISIIAGLLIIFLRPVASLAVYLTVLLAYPSYLMLNVGTININAARICVVILLIKCLADSKIRNNFHWSSLDKIVTISMAFYVGVFFLIYPLDEALQNRSGFILDTWISYIVTRLCIRDISSLRSVIKWVAIVLSVLGILAMIESVTGWQPYLPLTRYCPWRPEVRTTGLRGSWYRAIGPFGHPIMFGTCFALFLPLVYSLRHERDFWKNLSYLLCALILLGTIGSMSSGPWITAIVVIICIVMEKFKYLIKPLLLFLIFSCGFIAMASNRPFYHVIASYANPLGGSSWHRAKLIDCAIQSFNEWFLLGYKGQDPGWGKYLGSDHTDITNQFILYGVQYGILGIITLCLILITAIRQTIYTFKFAPDNGTKTWAWGLGSIIVATIVAFMSVSFFGQMLTLLYCLLGIIGSVCGSSARVKLSNTSAFPVKKARLAFPPSSISKTTDR